MLLTDVNVLIYAFREESPRHEEYRSWLLEVVNGPMAFGLSDLVLSGFLRIVTHPAIFNPPTPLPAALAFANALRGSPGAVPVRAGTRHWKIFTDLCESTDVRGKHIPDAFFAALAIEHGCEWVTTDRGFSRYPPLRWLHPLDG